MPVMSLSMVVLPEPEGPYYSHDLVGGDVERNLVQDFERIERLAHLIQRDHATTFRQRSTLRRSGRSTPNSNTAISASRRTTQA